MTSKFADLGVLPVLSEALAARGVDTAFAVQELVIPDVLAGRDVLARGDVKLDKVECLVLDEADRMLDMGFKPAVDRIVKRTPRDRQTLLFSATLEGAVGKLANALTRKPRLHEHRPPQEQDTIV